jgi:hypothetical protein
MGQKSGSGSGMNNPDHISEELRNNFFELKYFNSLSGSGMEKIRIRDSGSGINIPVKCLQRHPENAT